MSNLVKTLEIQTREGGWISIELYDDLDVVLLTNDGTTESRIVLQEDEAKELAEAITPKNDDQPDWW